MDVKRIPQSSAPGCYYACTARIYPASFGLPLKMNGMHRTQSDYNRNNRNLITRVLSFYRVKPAKAQHWSVDAIYGLTLMLVLFVEGVGGGGVGLAILLGMLHAKKTGIRSGYWGLWLVCPFTFFLPGPLKMSSTSNKFHNIIVSCTRLGPFF